MAVLYIPDDVVDNILTRLPLKPLLRFTCVSKHWNRLITNPQFLRSRSHRMIFLATATDAHHLTIHDNVPLDDTCQYSKLIKVHYPFENLKRDKQATILGTVNGLVLLQYLDIYRWVLKCTMILYNPFTRASKKIPYSTSFLRCRHNYAYGFGYGASTDDLRIIVFLTYGIHTPKDGDSIACEVFNFKTSRWSTCTLQDTNVNHINLISFKEPVGTFLNGYLYWIVSGKNMLIALNLRDMALSEIHLPLQRIHDRAQLGTIHGRLCLIDIDGCNLGLWVMNEQGAQNSWSNTCSCRLLDGNLSYKPICTLDNGRILMRDILNHQLIIYDTSNDSYMLLNTSPDDLHIVRGIEYVESLFSPSCLCFA